jgi:hypothetical protein
LCGARVYDLPNVPAVLTDKIVVDSDARTITFSVDDISQAGDHSFKLRATLVDFNTVIEKKNINIIVDCGEINGFGITTNHLTSEGNNSIYDLSFGEDGAGGKTIEFDPVFTTVSFPGYPADPTL